MLGDTLHSHSPIQGKLPEVLASVKVTASPMAGRELLTVKDGVGAFVGATTTMFFTTESSPPQLPPYNFTA